MMNYAQNRYVCAIIERRNDKAPQVRLTPDGASNHKEGEFHMATSNAIDSSIQIQLTKSRVTVVDAVDADLASKRWHTFSATTNPNVYARRTYRRKGQTRGSEFLHRTILERVLNRPLAPLEYVDHIDGDGLNNTRANLRLATRAQNNRNSKVSKNNKCGLKGVYQSKASGKWYAAIGVNSKNKHLGCFDTAEQAHEAYCKAADELWGEFSASRARTARPTPQTIVEVV